MIAILNLLTMGGSAVTGTTVIPRVIVAKKLGKMAVTVKKVAK